MSQLRLKLTNKMMGGVARRTTSDSVRSLADSFTIMTVCVMRLLRELSSSPMCTTTGCRR